MKNEIEKTGKGETSFELEATPAAMQQMKPTA